MPRTARAGERTLRYLDAPAGGSAVRGVLVLLHAFPLNARMWEPQLPLAALGWRIVAPQLRQFDLDGGAEAAAQTIDDYASDTIDLAAGLGLTSAIIGGLSLGGYVAFAVMRRQPSLFRGLVLADTRPQSDSPEGIEARKAMLKLVADAGPAAIAGQMLPKLVGSPTRSGRPDLVETIRSLALSSSTAAITGALKAMMSRPDSTGLLSSISCPTCIVVGAEDEVTPPAVAEEMHRAIPGSQLSVIAAAGHLSSIERPDAFNRALGRFLSSSSLAAHTP